MGKGNYITRVPMTIPGLTLWLDASDSSTITQSGGLLSSWRDKSGRGNNATQGTGSLQPSTGTRTSNGINVIDFPGDRYLQLTSNDIFDNPFTLFVVAAVDDVSQQDAFIGRQQGAANGGFTLRCNGDSTFTAFAVGASSTFSPVNIASVSTSPIIHRVSFNGAVTYALDNGSATSAGSITYNNAATITASIGAVIGGSVAAILDGFVGEIVIYNNILSAGQIVQMNRYLANKWGIAIS